MTNDDRIKLEPSWKDALRGEFEQPYMQQLREFLRQEYAAGKEIYPPGPLIFNALNSTPLDQVKVVILGQDPYHGPGQAHGLCFSVQPGVPAPPSLVNIYKELQRDLNIPIPNHGYLQSWAEQGVLLLNAVLTVEAGQAASHQKRGWEGFTDAIIAVLARDPAPKVFLLWGSHARRKAVAVPELAAGGGPHLVLHAPHPSPLSAHNGFLGCGHFGKANAFLASAGRGTIDWQLPQRVEAEE